MSSFHYYWSAFCSDCLHLVKGCGLSEQLVHRLYSLFSKGERVLSAGSQLSFARVRSMRHSVVMMQSSDTGHTAAKDPCRPAVPLVMLAKVTIRVKALTGTRVKMSRPK